MAQNKLIIPEGFVEYQESDLRFTGWEHECIIIDRTANHYLIPIARHNEMLATDNLSKYEPGKDSGYERTVISDPRRGVSGIAGPIGSGEIQVNSRVFSNLPFLYKWAWKRSFNKSLAEDVVNDLHTITYYQTSPFATCIPKITAIIANDHNDRFIRYRFEDLGMCLPDVKIKMKPQIQWIHQE